MTDNISKSKQIIKRLALALAYAGYLIIWCGIFYFIFILHLFIGYPSLISDAFGKWSVYVGIAVTLVAVATPLLLWKIHGWKRVLGSFLAVVLYVALSLGVMALAMMKFAEFTPEKWSEYPDHRYIMADDMFETVYGMDYDSAISLLGPPDYTWSSNYLYYNCWDGYVELRLDSEGIVCGMEH
ncbi:MAG: hypothetical protein IJ002_03765 [Clostridia bacterium]|nr:hypothetical protein [Clostridia bacterium]